MAKPFLKWAGGKGQLLSEINRALPTDMDSISTYIEPFVGGGAVLFNLLEKFTFSKVYIIDINEELVDCYKTIRNDVDSVILQLRELSKKFPQDQEARSEMYYSIREEWNSKFSKPMRDHVQDSDLRTAQFIFLNRTCYNGLFRVNSKGEFNVPFGNHANPSILREDNIRSVSKALEEVNIICSSFEECLNITDENTFVFIDPPYRPLPDTPSFTTYSNSRFSDVEQEKLAECFSQLDDVGAKLMLFNSDPKNKDASDNFFDNLYSKYNLKRVLASRHINSKGKGRGKVSEIMVRNYGGK